MHAAKLTYEEQIWEWLSTVADPEIPVLTILDLGIVRSVDEVVVEDGQIKKVKLQITPTYSGCPAMDVISIQIRMALMGQGVQEVVISEQLSPAWTTDWISTDGLQKMKAYGIAPPTRKSKEELGLFEYDTVSCPRCESDNTKLLAQFGSTSCKAMYQCSDCKEPFEHFKCH